MENLMLATQVLLVYKPTGFICLFFFILRDSQKFIHSTQCFFSLKDCRTVTMCITITAAQECFACHSMEMLQIFVDFSGRELNLIYTLSLISIQFLLLWCQSTLVLQFCHKKIYIYWKNVLVKFYFLIFL